MDDFERDYMAGEGAVLHRQKARLPKWVLGVASGIPAGALSIVGLTLLAAGIFSVLPALAMVGGGVLLGALIFLILVATGVTRITVSEGALDVQMGTGGIRIPIADIQDIRIGASGVRNQGIGVRRQLDGTRIYQMMGDNARAVRIERAGEPATVLVCQEPEALVEAVQRARAKVPRVRVADEAEPLEEELEAGDAKAKRRAATE
ncbi:MAG: hypothetical protein H6719_18850 [Sandaracinaceae bacterium]|nr:hypothetical protein [Sandaracinaceae bacterium]